MRGGNSEKITNKRKIILEMKAKLEGIQEQVNTINYTVRKTKWGFPGGTVVRNPPANSGDAGSSSGPGRSHMPRSN